jgi:peroxiredoxin
VGIALDQEAKVRDFAAKLRIEYPLLIAGGDVITMMQKLGNPSGGLPFTVILDRNGALVHRKLGAFKGAELGAAVQPLLG